MTEPAAPPAAPRLKRIEVTDFRAFPKGHPGVLDLGAEGASLLLFGENGAGKSSLYRALRDLFSVSPPPIADLHNVFSDLPSPSVRVTLTDGTQLTWSGVGHPTADVTDIARRSAFLTHTALRELVYNPGKRDEPLDLFQTMLESLIGDFDATLDGGIRRSVGELWADVDTAITTRVATANGPRRPRAHVEMVEAACARFNSGMRQALERLEPQVQTLLRRLLNVLGVDPMEFVGFVFTPVTYNNVQKGKIERQPLTASVRIRSHQPRAPQNFLNEGRQTALAIAVYLAARLICVPPGRDRLKLLVMDDLLISLDATHRRPVLDLVLDLFADWQILLLTHDRYWFQLAREQLTDGWKSAEIYERFDGDGLMTPYIRNVCIDMGEATLLQAEAFIADNHPAAACNYARSACELILKKFCAKRSVKFPYFEDDKRPDLNALLTAARAHVANDVPRLKALTDLEPHKRFVLNPLSHDPANPIPAADVRAAIEAVREVARACSRTYQ